MKAYKSLISFCLLLVAIKRGNSLYTPLDEKTVCVSGTLIQYTNYFACLCDEDKIHADEKTCVDPVEKCTKENEVCGEYAKCVTEGGGLTFLCKCNNGYEPNGQTPATCIPKGCPAFDKKCEGGTCIKKDDDTAQCGCNIGKNPGDKSDCVDSDKNAECKLTCPGENAACEINDEGFYECGCEEDYEIVDGVCVPSDDGKAFPGSGMLNVGLFFIVSSIVYVLA